MIDVVTAELVFSRNPCCQDTLYSLEQLRDDEHYTATGITIPQLFTRSALLGQPLDHALWPVVCYEVMGLDLFRLLADIGDRMPGVRESGAASIKQMLLDISNGVALPDHAMVEARRLAARRTMPDVLGEGIEARRAEADKWTTYQSSLCLLELSLGRESRIASPAMQVCATLATRSGEDPDVEYQWIIDEILGMV